MNGLTHYTKLGASLIAGTTAFLVLLITAAPVAFAVSPHTLSQPVQV